MNKVLRLTRHTTESSQQAELERIYGADVLVMTLPGKFSDVEQIKTLVAKYGADILEVVLPNTLLAQCLDPNTGVKIPIIMAVMAHKLGPDDKIIFTFSHYELVKKVTVETERL